MTGRATGPHLHVQPPDNDARDEQILQRRAAGRSYPAIARDLGLERGMEARAGFLRALRRQPPKNQRVLRHRELQRLDTLASRLTKRTDLDELDIARRLRTIERLREDLRDD